MKEKNLIGVKTTQICFPDFPVEKWDDGETSTFLKLPKEFDFAKFTTKKSEYIIELAKKIKDGTLSKNTLLKKDSFKLVKKELMGLHGVGKWTAEYVCLRCLKDPAAFPVDDVGLQNAIKRQLSLHTKPSVDEIYKVSRRWKNWEAYATFYLWNSLG